VGPCADVGFLRERRVVVVGHLLTIEIGTSRGFLQGQRGVPRVVQGNLGRLTLRSSRPNSSEYQPGDAQFVGDHVPTALVPAEVGQVGQVGGWGALTTAVLCPILAVTTCKATTET
jgi:hypothetical protein